MLDGIHENNILIEEITRATNEQSGAIIEVTTAVKQVDEMTQHNAALVEETTRPSSRPRTRRSSSTGSSKPS